MLLKSSVFPQLGVPYDGDALEIVHKGNGWLGDSPSKGRRYVLDFS